MTCISSVCVLLLGRKESWGEECGRQHDDDGDDDDDDDYHCYFFFYSVDIG